MQVDLLKNVVATIAGQQSVGIVDFLYGRKNVNEFLIAKKLNLTINQTRNILYKLADEGIVGFIRKKDKKKGGWYTYFWTLNVSRGLFRLRDHLMKNIVAMKSQMHLKKTERFYHCDNCSLESTEENALLYQYTCPECGEVLQLKDKSKEVEQLGKDIIKLESLLGVVQQEVSVVLKKEELARARKNRAEAKKKALERAAKKKKRDKLKKLESGKKSKKPSKAKKSKKKVKKSKGAFRKASGKKAKKPKKKVKKSKGAFRKASGKKSKFFKKRV